MNIAMSDKISIIVQTIVSKNEEIIPEYSKRDINGLVLHFVKHNAKSLERYAKDRRIEGISASLLKGEKVIKIIQFTLNQWTSTQLDEVLRSNSLSTIGKISEKADRIINEIVRKSRLLQTKPKKRENPSSSENPTDKPQIKDQCDGESQRAAKKAKVDAVANIFDMTKHLGNVGAQHMEEVFKEMWENVETYFAQERKSLGKTLEELNKRKLLEDKQQQLLKQLVEWHNKMKGNRKDMLESEIIRLENELKVLNKSVEETTKKLITCKTEFQSLSKNI